MVGRGRRARPRDAATGVALRPTWRSRAERDRPAHGRRGRHRSTPDLCGRLTVSVLRRVRRRSVAGLGRAATAERGDAADLQRRRRVQPRHARTRAADAPLRRELVSRAPPFARAARAAVSPSRRSTAWSASSASPGRGLGDTGEDCVIVDGDDHVLGLAGIMGGASSEIGEATTEVLLEAAYFDPMSVARGRRSDTGSGAKRRPASSEASTPAGVARRRALRRRPAPERAGGGVAARAPGRARRRADADGRRAPSGRRRTAARGRTGRPGVPAIICTGLGFSVVPREDDWLITAPSSRLDVRRGVAGRADVIEEMARLHGYRSLPRHTPTWPAPGGLTARQVLRRRVRDVLVDLGVFEAWTATLGSDEDFDVLDDGRPRVRVTNPCRPRSPCCARRW